MNHFKWRLVDCTVCCQMSLKVNAVWQVCLWNICWKMNSDAPRHKPQSLIPFPRVGRSRPMPNRVGLLSASWPFNGDGNKIVVFNCLLTSLATLCSRQDDGRVKHNRKNLLQIWQCVNYLLQEYQELREGKRHLIPFPRVGKRQSLIPFPRVGKAFPSEEFDDDSLIEDPYKIYYPTGM